MQETVVKFGVIVLFHCSLKKLRWCLEQ